MSEDFLQRLQEEANLQARLEQHRLLPPQIDWLTSLIGNYSWQLLLVGSGITALALEVFK